VEIVLISPPIVLKNIGNDKIPQLPFPAY
jgi:hypothetical protein